MVEHNSLQFIKKININRLLNNSKLNYFLILTLVLFIGCYHLLNKNIRTSITNFVTLPIILIFCMVSILLVGYNNITLGLLMTASLFIVLYPLDNIHPQQTANKTITEGFTNNKDSKRRQKEKFIQNSGERQHTVDKFKNYFRDIFDEAIKEEKEEMDDMIRENLHNRLEHEISNNEKGDNFTDVNTNSKLKESMTDVIHNNTPNVSKQGRKKGKSYQTIKVRKFDPTDDEDTNLLITKEILEDIINRITYQYESTDYLKRYISNRLQEIIRLNKLLNLDDNDDN
jgi:hypothetical protein